jgi:ABC-type glycerol-3-phosphate transport system substrate-binding protein
MNKLIFYLLICLFVLSWSCTSHQDSKTTTTSIDTSISTSLKQTPINWIANWRNRESKKNLLLGAAKEFNLLNQDLHINIKFQEEFCNNCNDARETIQDTIINMIHSGKVSWDIIVLTQKYYTEIGRLINDPEWGKKYLVNFEDFEWFRNSHNPMIFQLPQYREDFGGIIAGPLIEGRYFSLWYNKKVAEKIGIQIKPIGMTFDDFKGYIQKAYEYNKSNKDKVTVFIDDIAPTPMNELLAPLVLSELGDLETANVSSEKKQAALKKALKAFEELAPYKPYENVANVKYDKENDPILEGKVLFYFFPSSIINQWEDDSKVNSLNMLPAEFPVFEKPGHFYHGSYQSVWAVFKNAPHREEAIRFMQYMCSNDIAERWISSTKNPTAIKVKIDASDLGQDEIEKFSRNLEKKYGNKIKNYNLTKILFNKEEPLIDGIDVLKGKITANEYYDQILNQVRKSKK